MVYTENEVFGSKKIAECFNNYFPSVFLQDNSDVAIPLNQRSEVFLGDPQLSKAPLGEEIKNKRIGAYSFDGTSLQYLKSALQYISNQLLFIFSCC